jgi:hypothetical protein
MTNRLHFATVEAYRNGASLMPARRTRPIAFEVTVRRIANGCDFHTRLFAMDTEIACRRAMERARMAEKLTRAKVAELNHKGIAVFRIVSCEMSGDQSRPVG